MTPEFEGMNLVDLIDALVPVPEPPPISMMPQTAGWIWLGLAVLGLLAYGVYFLTRRHRANAYRRLALHALDGSGDRPGDIAAILRRTALAAFPRDRVAAETGASWLEFLDATYPGSGFASGAGQVLASAPYRGADPDPQVTALARDWIRHHRSEGH